MTTLPISTPPLCDWLKDYLESPEYLSAVQRIDGMRQHLSSDEAYRQWLQQELAYRIEDQQRASEIGYIWATEGTMPGIAISHMNAWLSDLGEHELDRELRNFCLSHLIASYISSLL